MDISKLKFGLNDSRGKMPLKSFYLNRPNIKNLSNNHL